MELPGQFDEAGAYVGFTRRGHRASFDVFSVGAARLGASGSAAPGAALAHEE